MLRSTRVAFSPLRPWYGLWIDGAEVSASRSGTAQTLSVLNPATSREATQVAAASAADVDAAVASSQAAFAGWSREVGLRDGLARVRISSLDHFREVTAAVAALARRARGSRG